MRNPIDQLRDLCIRILVPRELTEEEAAIIVKDYLDAEMRGKPSHALRSFSIVVEDCKTRGRAHVGFEQGPVVLFFSPSLFGVDTKEFHGRVDTFINTIKNARIAEGHEEVFVFLNS